MTHLTIEVPATSANLGPGFDTLAVALDIVDTLRVNLPHDYEDVHLTDVTGADVRLDPRDNLICRSYRRWFEQSGRTPPGAQFSLESKVPIALGLGSSAASIVGGLATAAFVDQAKDCREKLLCLAAEIEGHADNTSAAILGGLTTAFSDDGRVRALNVANHVSLGVVLFVPAETLPTKKARDALPQSVPFEDAVFDLGRLAYLTTALIWGKWDDVGPAMRDQIHQPYRTRLVPHLDSIIAAAVQGGAYGAALSGGGPSVIALAPKDSVSEVAAAMEREASAHAWGGKALVTSIRSKGVQVKKDEKS